MSAPKTPDKQVPDLRRRAGDRLRKSQGKLPANSTEADLFQVVHELQVHQIELELQNEELNQARAELAETLDKFTELYDFAPIGYLSLAPDGTILRANLTGAALLGADRDQLANRRFSDLLSEADRPGFSRYLAEVFSCPVRNSYELTLQQNPGPTRCLQVEAVSAESGQECRLAVIDISELKSARQSLLKTQKLESLGVLAGGIAHDFNNLLLTILGNISLARTRIRDPERLVTSLRDAESATIRAKGLTMQLLTFARGGKPIKTTIKLPPLLREILNLANPGSSVKCELDLEEELLPVHADVGQLSQVIHNLVLNAVQATPMGGRIVVAAENVTNKPSGKSMVKISVIDSGVGIPEEIQQMIFDPYFTTKQQGSGLGLAICYSIIKKHGGDIKLESSSQRGTTFSICLPAAEHDERIDTTIDMARQAGIVHGCGRVLIMDDEKSVRETTKALVEELGYQVECVADGRDVVELYQTRKQEGKPFDTVILDLTVPDGAGGKDAMAMLREVDPEVRAIVSSGYATDPVMASYRDHGFVAVLSKPYRIEELNRVFQDLSRSASEA